MKKLKQFCIWKLLSPLKDDCSIWRLISTLSPGGMFDSPVSQTDRTDNNIVHRFQKWLLLSGVIKEAQMF